MQRHQRKDHPESRFVLHERLSVVPGLSQARNEERVLNIIERLWWLTVVILLQTQR